MQNAECEMQNEDDKRFPPDVCPACGYSLQGLPGEGVCPECGNAYDSSQLILHGWPCGQHASVSNARGWRLFFAVVLPLGYSWQIFLPGTGNPWKIGMAALWGTGFAIAWFRRKSTDHPGGIQLRINRHGILQLDDLSSLRSKPRVDADRFTPWGKVEVVIWKQIDSGKLRVRMRQRARWWTLTKYMVDAEVTCSAVDAAILRSLIRTWQCDCQIK